VFYYVTAKNEPVRELKCLFFKPFCADARSQPTSPLIDSFCKRSIKFLRSCLASSNFVVNFIARYGVSYSSMFSCLGRNVQFCSERYGRKVGDIMNANVSLSFTDLDSSSRINPEMYDRAKLVGK